MVNTAWHRKMYLAPRWRASHSAVATIIAIMQLKFELIPHAPMYPDLASLDCYMFGPLRNLSGTKICQWLWSLGRCAYVESITIEKFLCRSDQKAREPLHNLTLKKGVIILRNDTLCTLLLSQVVVHEVNNKFSLLLIMSRTRNLITRCLGDTDLIDCKSVARIWGKNIVCCVQRVKSQ
jgi:hypothetical protein